MVKKNLEIIFRDKIIKRIRQLCTAEKIEVYLVGGFLRDWFIERHTNDYDFVVINMDSALFAEKIAQFLKSNHFLLDEKERISRVVLGRDPSLTIIDFSNLKHPNIIEDLKSRDFTVNSLGLNLLYSTDKLLDPVGGVEDINKRLIRANSEASFCQDPLRLLRAFRFASELGFKITAQTKSWISNNRNLIKKVAPERIVYEFFKIFEERDTSLWIRELDEVGLLNRIIPELDLLKRVGPSRFHHLDLWEHSLGTVDALEKIFSNLKEIVFEFSEDVSRYLSKEISSNHSKALLLKFCALLHDVGKYNTQSKVSNQIKFIGHESVGAKISLRISRRLKLSKKEKQFIELVLKNHMWPGYLVSLEHINKRSIHKFFKTLGEDGVGIILLSLADRFAACGEAITDEVIDRHKALARRFIENFYRKEVSLPKFVDGYDIMNKFNIKSGPMVGKILQEIEAATADGRINSKEEALDFAQEILKDMVDRNPSSFHI